MSATVYLVGAGPGAPDLLTLRAARLLAQADVVLHDALVPEAIVAVAANAQKIAVGKRCGRFSTAQRFINRQLLAAARRHRLVVRLKGGDPMLFGRAHEEISFLAAHGITVEIVPGVTAACAASAAIGVSLTRRGVSRSVAFATPRCGEGEAPSQWAEAVASADTAVLYMAAYDAPAVLEALLAAGLPPQRPLAVVANASLPGQVIAVGTLSDLPRLAGVAGGEPTLILLGEVLGAVQALAGEVRVPRTASHSA
jgi:uroporphyrin-III C-methyltransferase